MKNHNIIKTLYNLKFSSNKISICERISPIIDDITDLPLISSGFGRAISIQYDILVNYLRDNKQIILRHKFMDGNMERVKDSINWCDYNNPVNKHKFDAVIKHFIYHEDFENIIPDYIEPIDNFNFIDRTTKIINNLQITDVQMYHSSFINDITLSFGKHKNNSHIDYFDICMEQNQDTKLILLDLFKLKYITSLINDNCNDSPINKTDTMLFY